MTSALLSESTNPPPAAEPRRHARAPLTVTARRAPPVAVVLTVLGDVDMATSPLLRAHLLQHLRDTHQNIVVDLTRVNFFGAAGLTVLVDVREAAVAAGVRLSLVARTRVVLLPLTITGLDREFDISPDLAGALLDEDE